MRQLDERRLRTSKILRTWGRVVAFAQLFFGMVWVVVAASTQKGRDEVFVLPLVLLLIGGATLSVFVWLSHSEPSQPRAADGPKDEVPA